MAVIRSQPFMGTSSQPAYILARITTLVLAVHLPTLFQSCAMHAVCPPQGTHLMHRIPTQCIPLKVERSRDEAGADAAKGKPHHLPCWARSRRA